MLVSSCEPAGKGKYKISLDEDAAFWLYASEVRAYSIAEGAELKDNTVEEIFCELVIPRAKKKAMDLLLQQDRTEQDLRQKLNQNGFFEAAAEAAIQYVKQFNYLDDDRYTENLIRSKMGSKSRREIECMLLRKGMKRTQIKDRLDEAYQNKEESNPESEAILRMIQKKIKDPSTATADEKRKLRMALVRKGFEYDLIQSELASYFGTSFSD